MVFAERLLAFRCVARAAGEQVEPMPEPFDQRLGREHREARGRELDGQGQAVEPHAELDDGRCVRRRELELRPDRPRARDEELHRLGLGQLRDRRRIGDRARAAPVAGRRDLLARHVQRFATRDERP